MLFSFQVLVPLYPRYLSLYQQTLGTFALFEVVLPQVLVPRHLQYLSLYQQTLGTLGASEAAFAPVFELVFATAFATLFISAFPPVLLHLLCRLIISTSFI